MRRKRTNRHVLLQAGAESAAGHLPNLHAVGAQQLRVLPGRRASGHDEAHAAAGDTLCKLPPNHVTTNKVERFAPALACRAGRQRRLGACVDQRWSDRRTDSPGKARLDGRDVLVQVVAV
jgi:hypothetical protein